MTLNRRTFLKSLGAGAATYLLGNMLVPAKAAAQSAVDRNYVFCYFEGGWDTLLSLDPRDPDEFTAARVRQTRIELAWDRIDSSFTKEIIRPTGSNIGFGPAAEVFARHYDVSCAVRGISMDTVTHEVGRRYFITGQQPRGLTATGSSAATRITAQQGGLATIPNLASRVEAYNDGLDNFATALGVNSTQDLVTTLTDLPGAPPADVRKHLDAYRRRVAACDPASNDRRGFLGLIAETQQQGRALVSGGVNRLFDFTNGGDADMREINQRYRIGNNVTGSGAQAALAYQALRHGVAQNVSIELASGLDTHDDTWAADHPTRLRDGFSALATLVDDLRSTPHPSFSAETLLDRTTIVVFSEFGRTPLINARQGRDHSLANSALLIGAGVPHNRVVGATSDVGQNPMAVDPDSGAPVGSGGVTLSPTLVLASVMQSGGFDTSDLRVDGLPCLMA